MSGEGPRAAGSGGRHLRQDDLDGYFLGRVSGWELLARTTDHLARTCRGCRRKLGPEPLHYRRLLERAAERLRVHARELADERAQVPGLLAELGSRAALDRYLLVVSEARFHTPAFVDRQVAVGWDAVAQGALRVTREALELASAAVLTLPVERYGKMARFRLEGEVELLRARLLLVEGDGPGATRALDAAWDLEGEVCCPHLRAGVLVGRAFLHLARGERSEARSALESASATGSEAWRPSIAEGWARLEGRPVGEEPADLTPPVGGRERLRRWWRRQGTPGLRLRMALGVAHLARRLVADAPSGERTAALRELATVCQELVEGPVPSVGIELPAPAAAELARFTRKLLSGKVDADEITAFENALLSLQPPWGPPTMRHDPPEGRFPAVELTTLLEDTSEELRAILVAHGLSDREVEDVLQDATMALLQRWDGLDDRREWLLDRVRRLCRQTVAQKAENGEAN